MSCTPRIEDLPQDVQKVLCTIDKAQLNVIFIIAALVISICAANTQKKQVVCSVTNPDKAKCFNPFPQQIIAAIIILIALLFFFNLSRNNVCENTDNTNRSPSFNFFACILAVAACIVIFYNIIYSNNRLRCKQLNAGITNPNNRCSA